jgi:uncharacterized repeat protein (TIGR01451 family)
MKFTFKSQICGLVASALLLLSPTDVSATTFTMTVPTTGVALPAEYPAAGGVAVVMTGVNGNIYYQFSNPTGAFVGFQNNGSPAAFRGNPFTINDPISLDCGFRSCTDYFGGAIARVDIRFSAYDGDTQVGGFDEDDISLFLNGYNVGNWSGRTTDNTNLAGTTSFGLVDGFGNNTFNTGWFSSTNTALLANILQTGQTSSQVFDDDPNDNYWDFTYGNNLPREDLRTIAPGYEFEKTINAGDLTYAVVGDIIDYTYTVRNIGSVDIDDITVEDDRIANVTCPAPPNNSLARTRAGTGQAQELTCTGSYRITQADIDAGSVTNIAKANGTPEYGELGEVSDTATTTGPAANNAISLTKQGSPTVFGAVGSTVTYTLVATNDGNTTLQSVLITDPRVPSQSCSFATILPLSADNPVNTASCTLSYQVTQADVDAFALNGTQLLNTATVRATPPNGTPITATGQSSLAGQPAVVGFTMVKTALQSNFDAVGDVLDYRFTIRNVGNVTWPAAPAIVDNLTTNETCPAGSVAPGATVVCTASYAILQSDLDAGVRDNEATATLTLAGQTASVTDDVSVPAVTTTGLTLVKRLQSGSPNPFTAINQVVSYDFVLRNTGTVSLAAPSVADATTGANAATVPVTCPAGPILPNGSLTCTASYTVTQADLDAGTISNTATASATAPAGAGGGTISSAPKSVTVTGTRRPALSMVKTAPTVSAIAFASNPTVTYTFEVENTGNVTIPGPITVTDDKLTPNTFECGAADLVVGANLVCDAPYTVTVGDNVAGFVRNSAFATGADGTQSNTDTAIIPQDGTFDFLLEKDAITTSYSAVGDPVDFTLTFTNTGTQTIFPGTNGSRRDNFVLSDPGISFVNGCTLPAELSPQGSVSAAPSSFSCTVRRAVTQSDIDSGTYTNTANLTLVYFQGQPEEETQVVPPASATVPLAANVLPSFAIDKVSTDDFAAVGNGVDYTFTVTNTSAITLTNVVLSDPLIPNISCVGSATANTTPSIPPAGQTPNNVATCTGTYNVTQADLDAGQVDNTVTAVATTQTGVTVTETADETVAIDPNAATRSLTLVKSAVVTETGDATFTAPGQTATYTLTVENNGNLTLKNIAVSDPDLGFSCVIPTLAPQAAPDTTCSVTRQTTQADFDAGSYLNTASASATGAATVSDSTTITAAGPARTASFVFDKTAPTTFSAVGDIVDFVLGITNTGTVTLTNITISDPFLGAAFSCTIPSLAPGAADTSCRGSHTIVQADIDAGQIENNASFTGTGLDGAAISGNDTVVVTGPAGAPSLRVTKTEVAANGTFANLPTTESFTFTVRNTGNVTLTGLSITDPLTGFTCPLADLAPNASTATCLDANIPLSTTYTVTQSDIDRGSLENTATATGNTTLNPGVPVTASGSVTLQAPTQLPALSMVKTATAGDNYDAVGDTVSYQYVVTNAGNITLTAPIRVTDDKVTVSCPGLPAGGLAPMLPLTCTATYVVTQADLDAGSILNTATAQISQPVQPSAAYPTGVANVTSNTDTATVTADQNPALAITKRIKPNTASSFDAPGDLSDSANPNNLVFEFIVRNTGNVTTTTPIEVSDPLIQPANLVCTTAPLAPGAQVICSLPYAPTQADVDAGSFANTANAVTEFNNATVTTLVPGTATAGAVRRPSLLIDKQLSTLTAFSPGEVATYSYTVTNNGNTTITAPISVNDDKITGPINCGTADLAPGDVTVCTADYTVRERDLDFGSVTNTATGTNGAVTSDPVSLTIPPGATPTLSIQKIADVASFTQAGAVIPYRFIVTNTSTGRAPPAFIEPVTIVDNKITTGITCPVVDAANPLQPFAPDNTITCTGSYTVTQADVDAVRPGATVGFVINNAYAQADFAGEAVSSPSVQARVNAATVAELTVAKTAENDTDPGAPAAAGDVILFTIATENTGPQTVTGVTVDDPFVGALTCDITAPVTLAPNDVLTCTGTYTVTQADVDAGDPIANTATASATTTQGQPVTDDDNTTYAVAAPLPALTIVKDLAASAAPTDYTTVGEALDFRITVTNSGNITLNDVEVTDSLVPGTCIIGTLLPGAVDTSCVFTHVVLQSNIDDGQISNTATGTAQPANPGAAPLSESSTKIATGPDQEPAIGLSKTGSGPVTAGDGSPTYNVDGQTLSYVYTISNLGNVTLLSPPQLSDNRIATLTCDPFPANGLLPTESLICRGTDVVDQADVDAGFVTNNANVVMSNPYGNNTPLTATASETITATATPDISLSKVASVTDDVTVGTEVTYSYTVQNPGNVTLSNITLVDFQTSAAGSQEMALTDNGLIATLEPGGQVVLTSTYVVTQADIDSGNAVRNTVRLTSTLPNGDAGPTDIARERVNLLAQAPEMTAIKTIPDLPTALVDGTDIVFEITLTNTGNVTLTEPDLTDSVSQIDTVPVIATPLVTLIDGDAGVEGVFEVDEVRTYSVTYRLTQADIDAGGIQNTVLITAEDPLGGPVTEVSDNGSGDGDDPTLLAIAPAGQIDVTKLIPNPPTDPVAGTLLTFELRVANTGNVTLTAPDLTEDLRRNDTVNTAIVPQPTPARVTTSDVNGNSLLDVGETWIYTINHTLTQDDIDAGGVANSVGVITNDPNGTVVPGTSHDDDDGDGNTVDDPTVYTIAPDPMLDLTKIITQSGSALGDTVMFQITAVNLGNVTLFSPALTDTFTRLDGTAITGVTPVLVGPGTAGDPLLPDGTRVWTLTHTLTQTDIDAGGLRNTATLTTADPDGRPVVAISDDNDDNDGNAVDDPTDLPIAGETSVNLTKVLTTNGQVAGNQVVFTLTATNTGTLSLNNVSLADTFTRANGTPITTASPVLTTPSVATQPLLPLATREWTLTHVLSQDDIDAGGLRNTATVSGTGPGPMGATVSDVSDDGDDADGNTADDPAELLIASTPLLEVTKTISQGGSAVGDTVIFEITAVNLGNVTLRNFAIVDTLTDANGAARTAPEPVLQTGASPTVLNVGGVNVYTLTYVLTQPDVDAGGLRNTVTGTGTTLDNVVVSDMSDDGDDNDGNTANDPTLLSVVVTPALSAVKEIIAGPAIVGGRVVFDIRVKNTGNVTLRQVEIASDTLTRADGTPLTLSSGPVLRLTDMGSAAGTLKVGETGTWRASYVLTQPDIDAGGINNIAVATGTPLVGNPVTAQTRDTDAADGNPAVDPTVLLLPQTPALAIDKVLVSGGPVFSTVGHLLSYRFDVTNTGNVTLTNNIAILDPKITDAGGVITCPTGPLAPAGKISCTATYAVTQADIDAGFATNTARATSGATTSAPDSVTVQAQQNPALGMTKTAVSITVNGTTYTDIDPVYFQKDAVVRYTYLVENTGNTTITDTIGVTDNLTTVVCPALTGGLAPGGTTTCNAEYTVNLADVAAGAVTNVARATAGAITSPNDSATIPTGAVPALDLTKALISVTNADSTVQPDLLFDAVGDILTYQFTLFNSGNASYAREIIVNDPRIGSPFICYDPVAANDDLASGETETCTATYVVTQDDLDRSTILNEASATTRVSAGGDTTTVSSGPAQALSPANVTSSLSLTKTAAVLPISGVGQTLTYTLTAENTGNQRLRAVEVVDVLLPDLSCTQAILEPQQTLVCSDTYIVTQDDVDAGVLNNTADVSAINPQGQSRTATDTLSLATPAADNDLQLAKVASVAAFGAPGSTVTFDLIVTNNGNLTLFDLVLTDPAIDPDYECRVPRLAPGATNNDCSVARTVTQADVDAGTLSNTAFVTGRDAQNGAVETESTVTVPSQPRLSALDVTKVLTQRGSEVGDTIVYEIAALNSGDVTLRNVEISDDFSRFDDSVITENTPVAVDPAALTAPLIPGDSLVWTFTHELTQDDIDAGGLRNVATATALDPDDAGVSDVSDDGDDGDGNAVNDPTLLSFIGSPAIELEKRLTTSGGAVGDVVVFTLAATNIGNTTLTDLVLTDTFTRADDTVIDDSVPVADDPSTVEDPLAPGATRLWTLQHTLTQDDVDAGGLSNTATVTATSASGDSVTDVSDNGIDDDGNTTNDPAVLPIIAGPGVNLTKVITQSASAVGDTVIYEITATNTGNVTLSDLVLTDTLTALDGTARDAGEITLTSGADAATLGVGQVNTYAVSYVLIQDDIDAGGLENVAQISAKTPNGDPISDVSDNGNDRDGNIVDDPTVLLLEGVSSIEVTKSVGTPVREAADRVRYDFDIVVGNTGTITQTGLQIVDDLRRFAAPAVVISVNQLQAVGFTGTGGRAASFDGVQQTQTLRGDVILLPGESGTVSFSVLLDPSQGYPAQDNVADVTSDRIIDPVSGSVTVPTLPPAEVRVVKTADTDTALLGGTVGYTLTFENLNASTETGLTFVDALPDGLTYTPGTARYDGTEGSEPVIDGSRLEWRNITLGPLQKVTITLSARVTGGDGDLTNTAYVLDPGQNIISNTAEARISRRPEAVFDCGDVIGKVFDDRNLNGYQDGIAPVDRSLITDQTYYGDKKGPPEEVLPGGEPGLAGVRLATVSGTVITTDAYGRFSVPCAELPANIGSNFTLKLDTRTLPTGYLVTTENPRTLRLTPGTVAKMNFGAAITNVVDIDLTAAAFIGQTSQTVTALPAGVEALIGQIRDVPSVLRLTYYTQGEGRDLARMRLDAVDDLIQSRWRGGGEYKLLIERTIKALQ